MTAIRRTDLAAAGGLLGAALLAFWKVLLGPFVLLKGDLFYFRYALQWSTVSAWASGHLPLLDASLGGGEPLLANPSHAALYPGLALYAALPFPLAWDLTAALHVAWAGLGLYVLARRLGAAPPAALAGGLVFALSGPLLSSVSFYVLPQTASWLPWALALSHRAFFRGGRSVPLAGLALAMQLLVPEPLVVLGTWLVLFGAWSAGLWAGERSLRARRARHGLAIAAVGLLASAAQTLPALLWLPHSTRAGGVDYAASASVWSLAPARLAELVLPGFFGSSTGTAAAEFWGGRLNDAGMPLLSIGYLGVLPLVLLPSALSRRAGRAAAALAALSLLLALGRHTPLGAALFHALPPFRVARYPEKWLLFASLAAAVITALGARPCEDGEPPRRRALLGLGLAAVVLGAAQVLAPALASTAEQRGAQAVSALHAWLVALAAAGALLTARDRNPGTAWALPTVAALDLLTASRLVDFSAPAALVRDAPALLRAVPALRDGPAFHRGLDEAARYDTAGAEPLGVMQAAAHPLAGVPWGLRYAVHEDVDRAGFRPAAERSAFLRARFPAPESLEVLRRAGVRHVVTLEPAQAAGLTRVASVPIGPAAMATVYGLDGGGVEARRVGGSGTATLSEAGPARLVVDLAGDAPGGVVLARNALPGWSLTLDGVRARLGATRDGWLAFEAPAGRHRAFLRYTPPGLAAGLALSALGLLLAAGLAFRRWPAQT